MAAYGVAYGGSIFAGALGGFFSSLFPKIGFYYFDDGETFTDVVFGDNLSDYNDDPDAETEDKNEVVNTDRAMLEGDGHPEIKLPDDDGPNNNNQDLRQSHTESSN